MATDSELLRVLTGFASLFVIVVGIMMVTGAWMNGAKADFTLWTVLIAGGLMWLQAVPVLKASERAEMKQRFLDELNRKK